MRGNFHRAFVLAAATVALSGCGTFLGSGPRTSPERVLANTAGIDRDLTAQRAAREPAGTGQVPKLARAPLERIRVTSAFHGKGRRNHQGVDLDARRGTPILAAEAGIVVHAGEGMRGYGLTVIVRHGRGLSTLYAHADEIVVTVGDRVVSGQTLGYVGSTGNASGPHLHFEVRRDTAAVDPMPHLPK